MPTAALTSFDSAAQAELLVFELDGNPFGIPSQYVREIVRAVAMTTIPDAPEWLAGVINVRGRSMTVIDLRNRLFRSPPRIRLEDNIVLIQTTESEFAVLVDRCIDVRHLPLDLERFDKDSTSIAYPTDSLDGENTLMLLDLRALVSGYEQYFSPTGDEDDVELFS